MYKKIPFIARVVARIGIIILWTVLSFIERILSVFNKWLKKIISKPI